MFARGFDEILIVVLSSCLCPGVLRFGISHRPTLVSLMLSDLPVWATVKWCACIGKPEKDPSFGASLIGGKPGCWNTRTVAFS